MLIACKTFYFDAAHYIPEYHGDCSRLHGHTYKVEVACGVNENARNRWGMVVDFADIKTIAKPIITRLDHHLINEIIEVPTAENIAEWIYNNAKGKLPLLFVRVWETPTCYAEKTTIPAKLTNPLTETEQA